MSHVCAYSSQELYFRGNQKSGAGDDQTEEESGFTLIQTNTLSATLVGFISRILIERNFFQNSQIPADLLLYLANDLIKIVAPQKKEVLNMATEASVLWKQFRGTPLTREDEAYLDSPKEIDVPGEILNGLKYSSMALMGQSFCRSITSIALGQLWNHVPAICGYFGAAMIGPQAVAYAVTKVLQNTTLPQKQKSLVEPWLNMVGRLALGLVPKVDATEEGVRYHYPSIEGYSQTISGHQTITVRADTLSIERPGHLQTPNDTFEGVYAADFKLCQIYELCQERIRIRVMDKNGVEVPVVFTKIWGEYGPEISVFSTDKELEYQWSQHFRPKQTALSIVNTPPPERQNINLYEALSCKSGRALSLLRPIQKQPVHQTAPLAHFNREVLVLSAFCVLTGLVGGGRHQDNSITSVALLTLSLLRNVKAVDDNPIGTIIAYASYAVPSGYIRCDGSFHSKDEFRELYEVLQGHCEERGNEFQVPQYHDIFLRGSNEKSEIGRLYEYTTGMPKNSFQGLANGAHNHKSDLAGEHNSISNAGEHQHTINKGGGHAHPIQSAGQHDHQMDEIGEHNHNKDAFAHLLQVDGQCVLPGGVPNSCYPPGIDRSYYPGIYEPCRPGRRKDLRCEEKIDPCQGGHPGKANLCDAGAIQPAGKHRHTIDKGGDHVHGMDQAGDHDHEVSKEGGHTHTLSLSMDGEHTHKIVGGDEETRPKNRKVAYLIKAKPNKQVKDLQKRLQKLEDDLERNQSHSTQTVVNALLVVTLGALAFKAWRPRTP